MATDNGQRAAIAKVVIQKWRAFADAARAAGKYDLAAQADAEADRREAQLASK